MRKVDQRARNRTTRRDGTARESIHGGTLQDHHVNRAEREVELRRQDLDNARKGVLSGFHSRPLNYAQLEARIRYTMGVVAKKPEVREAVVSKYSDFVELEYRRKVLNEKAYKNLMADLGIGAELP